MKFELTPVRTYATVANAEKAVTKKLVNPDLVNKLHWYIAEQGGRFFPVFVGERALQHGMHFHFNCVA